MKFFAALLVFIFSVPAQFNIASAQNVIKQTTPVILKRSRRAAGDPASTLTGFQMKLYQNLSLTTDLSQAANLYNNVTYNTISNLSTSSLNIASDDTGNVFDIEKDKDIVEFDITSSSNSSAPSIKYRPLILSTYANIASTSVKVNVSSAFNGNNLTHSQTKLQVSDPRLLFIRDGQTLNSAPASADANTIFMKLKYFCIKPPTNAASSNGSACASTNANGQALTGVQSSDPSFTYNIGSSDAEKNAKSVVLMLAPSEIRFASAVNSGAYNLKYKLTFVTTS